MVSSTLRSPRKFIHHEIFYAYGSSFVTSDNNSFPSGFVEYSTDIAVLIAAFLIRISVQAGQEAPVSFNTRFSVKGGLNSEYRRQGKPDN